MTPPRADTESDPSPLSMVREDVVELRDQVRVNSNKLERIESDLKREQDLGKEAGRDVIELKNWRNQIEKEMAREEGRDEVRDQTARAWGKGGTAVGGIAVLIEILSRLLGGG